MLSLSNHYKNITHITAALLLATMALSATGCNTTQEFKPTASVMVGAHKSLWWYKYQYHDENRYVVNSI